MENFFFFGSFYSGALHCGCDFFDVPLWLSAAGRQPSRRTVHRAPHIASRPPHGLSVQTFPP